MTDANTRQVGGTHYLDLKIQPWDALAAWFPESYGEWLVMTAIVYLARHHDKGGKEDIAKAIHCLEKWMETQT